MDFYPLGRLAQLPGVDVVPRMMDPKSDMVKATPVGRNN
jgi:hypothetical protein